MITACASDLQAHLGELCYLYSQGQAADACHEPPAKSAARPPAILKTALPTVYNRTASQAKTFLAECRNFMALNTSNFPDNQLRIWWTLQLCSDQAATWKRIQLELLEEGTDVPHHLLHWNTFQQNFLLTWVDLNAQNKAQARLLAGVKQTTSVQCYMEAFEELVLEAQFHDPDVLIPMFYEGLKWEIKQHLVGKSQNELTLAELKALAITLDEERMNAERYDPKSTMSQPHSPDPHVPNRELICKAEMAHVGTPLSVNDQAQYMHEG